MKKDKVQVKICVGTACFVQGGSDLLLYNDFVDPAIIADCEIEGCSCLDVCKASGEGAPYVQIDGQVYGKVTQEEFSRLLTQAVKKNA